MPCKIHTVTLAEPYRFGAMGSLGDASHMFLAQYKFPYQYESRDKMLAADHDRCFQWDYAHARAACDNHMHTGELHIGDWVRKQTPERVFAFLKDILKADSLVKWTGWRVCGTVNLANGYPVFSLSLFAKNSHSNTKVYTGDDAPNVGWHVYSRVPEEERATSGLVSVFWQGIRRTLSTTQISKVTSPAQK